MIFSRTTTTTTTTYAVPTNILIRDSVRCKGMRKLYENADNAAADEDETILSIENTIDDCQSIHGKKHKQHNHYHHIDNHPIINNSTKCAKMTEEHGMIRNGSLNGVGIANILANFNYAATTTPTVTTTASNIIANSAAGSGGGQHTSPSSISGTSNNSNSGNGTRQPILNGNNGDGCSPPPPTASNNNSANNNKLPIVINSNGQTHGLGGRLQFFKDGKFILELARSREGDRTGWVSVPRKTYWPPAPQTVNTISHPKNESSTSLSFSDDNSSIQSSPWQRDHCWKQANPRRSISKEMSLYFYRPSSLVLSQKSRAVTKLKRRRPYDNKISADERVNHVKRPNGKSNNNSLFASNDETACVKIEQCDEPIKSEQSIIKKTNVENEQTINENVDAEKVDNNIKLEVKRETDGDTVDSIDNSISGAEESKSLGKNGNGNEPEPMIVDECPLPSKSSPKSPKYMVVMRSRSITILKRPDLKSILQKLMDRAEEQPLNMVSTKTGPGAGLSGTGNYISPNSTALSRNNDLYYQQQHVSPRKRILREFEKVSLEDSTANSTKRSRSKGNSLNGIGQHLTHIPSGTATNIPVSSINTGSNPTSSALSFGNATSNSSIANGNHSSAPATTTGTGDPAKSITNTAATAAAATPTSRPFSSYSITSLLGHSVNNNSGSKADCNTARDSASEYATRRSSPKSPTPISPAHQSSLSSSRFNSSNAKKKSPPNGNTVASSTSNGPYHHHHHQTHRSPMNSPVSYGRTATHSPNLSPSPEQIMRQQRQQYGNPLSSISSPTSGFHPYMPPTTRASPSTSGALSPPMATDLQRYRNSYKTTGSPSSSIGAGHSYSSTSGSPSSYSARYSPSTYSQLSPPPATSTHSTAHYSKPTGSPYSISSFLQGSNSSAGNSKNREVSPPRSTSSSTPGTRTIPKKTASIRQQYGSPNSDKYNYPQSRGSSTTDNSPPSSRSDLSPHAPRKTLLDSTDPSSKSMQRSTSPTEALRRQYEKEYHSRFSGNDLDRPPPLIPSMHTDGMPPPSSYYNLYPPQSIPGSVSQSMAAAAAAAYLTPYYHSMGYGAAYRNPLWMHHPYPAPPLSPTSRAGLVPYGPALLAPPSTGLGVPHPTQMQPAASQAMAAELLQSQAATWGVPSSHHHINDVQPLPLVKEEPSSDVPLNLSKH